MYRDDVADRLRARERDGYLMPDYDGYCFARVLPTLYELLGVETGPGSADGSRSTLPSDVFEGVNTTVENVLLVLIDGFGDDLWRRHGDDPFVSRMTDRGTVTPLTSIYPSETASAIPSLHTGSTTACHGSIGWDQWMDEAGSVVSTLPFIAGSDGEPADEAVGATSEMLFDAESCHTKAVESGVNVELFMPREAADGVASERMGGLAGRHSYWNVADLAVSVRQTLEASEGPTLAYAYFPHVDAAAHSAGTDSEAFAGQLRLVTHAVQRELLDELDPDVAEKTLVVATADHGLLDTNPETNVDIRDLDGVMEHRRMVDGEPIPPVGSGRNVHLFLEPGTVECVRANVESQLDARTYTREEAIAEIELFGPNPGERIRRRCGDLVVIPERKTLWYDPSKLEYVGMHGGLSPEEMLVPFAVAPADELQR